MDTSKLKPNDPRVKSCFETIRGKKYHYIVGEPSGPKRDTMLLVHGFPDMAFGWRYQIPYFMSKGYQVIVPDNVGYAQTDAPEDLSAYTMKNVTEDLAELARKFVGQDGQIVLGGHDWGGMVVWRMAERFPELIKVVFSVCTPYAKASRKFTPLEDIIKAGILTNFTYQLQLKGPDVESKIQGRAMLRKFLNGLYEGRGPNREVAMRADKGVLFENLDCLRPTPLLSPEELDFYADEYARQTAPELRGPLNWYRTRELNHDLDQDLVDKGKVPMPALFIAASKDIALPPAMSIGMEEHFEDLSRGEVDATHWALWQAADEVNRIVDEWLDKKLPVKSAL